MASRTLGELMPLISDLPVARAPRTPTSPRRPPAPSSRLGARRVLGIPVGVADLLDDRAFASGFGGDGWSTNFPWPRLRDARHGHQRCPRGVAEGRAHRGRGPPAGEEGAQGPRQAAADRGLIMRSGPGQSRQNSLPSGSCHDDVAGTHRRRRLVPLDPGGAQGDQPLALRLQRGHPLVALEPGGGADVEVHPVLRRLALGHLLEEQPRPDSRRGPEAADELLRSLSGTPTSARKLATRRRRPRPVSNLAPGGAG